MPLIKRVVAVVVSYHPDTNDFLKLLETLLPQVAYAVIVDNASLCDMAFILAHCSGKNIELMRLQGNFGIAAAQNAGIARAMKLEADFVLLLDQDSVPSPVMVAELLDAIKSVQAGPGTMPVAAVGPAIVDRRTGRTYYFMIDRLGFPHRWRQPTDIKKLPQLIDVEVLVASGTLIPIEVIKRIGAMRSNYFIDHVDTEWCLRARAAGYRLIGVPSSRLEHQFGDTCKQVWFFGYRQVIYHSPLRNYYSVRNTLLMLSNTTMSWAWRIHFIWRLVRLGYFLVFAEDRWLRLQRIALGLIHALRGRGGRLETKTNHCRVMPVSDIEPDIRT